MESAFNILVVILSIFLAIFLLLGITVLFYAWKIAKTAKNLSSKAEATFTDAQSFINTAKDAVAPAVAAKLVTKAIKNFTNKSKVKVKKK